MSTTSTPSPQSDARPTIVLVHGSWADASSWTKVAARLQQDGFVVRGVPNELRSLAGDAAVVRAFVETIDGPVVLVAHSYGGAVITNAATGLANVTALVYVNAFAPDEGESAFQLAGPDSALAAPDPTTVFDLVPPQLPPVPDSAVYLKESAVAGPFAAGLSAEEKALVFATQRPAAFGALVEGSGAPAWKSTPSWYLLGLKDQIIPPSAQRTMAERAGSTISEYDAGHLGLLSESMMVVHIIEGAAEASLVRQ